MPTFEAAKQGYINLWAKMHIRPERLTLARAIATRLNGQRRRYEVVSAATGVPWWFIAIVHELEAGGSFNAYLGNGQPLNRVTTLVPRGRGPFSSWESGALDTLRIEGVDKIKDWSIPRALYMFESYNGFGYAHHNVNSPYVWSFSNLYERGKFVADGRYDATAVSQQCGAAVVLYAMFDLKFIGADTMSDLANLLKQFDRIAPTIAGAIGGPVAGIAVKVVADAFAANVDDPADIVSKINATPVQTIVQKLSQAEATIQQVAGPVDGPLPPAPTPIAAPDQGLGVLTGYKTMIGIAIVGLAYAAGAMHYLTPDAVAAVQGLGFTIGGIGLMDKVQRYLPFIVAKKA